MATVLHSISVNAQVNSTPATETMSIASNGAPGAPSDSGMNAIQWRAMLSHVGIDRSNRLLSEYRKAAEKRADGRGASYSFSDFLKQREAEWTQHRNGGIAALVAGAAVAILGGVMYQWCKVHNRTPDSSGRWSDEPNFCPTAVLSTTLPVSAALFIVGAPLVGVFQTRLNDLERARSEGRSEGSLVRWTGIALLLDPIRGTRGASLSFAF
jgi:hypothetical protein